MAGDSVNAETARQQQEEQLLGDSRRRRIPLSSVVMCPSRGLLPR
jgi:hypothetical protein